MLHFLGVRQPQGTWSSLQLSLQQEGEETGSFGRASACLAAGTLHIQLTFQPLILPGVPRAHLFWRCSPMLHAQHSMKPTTPLTSGNLACVPVTEQVLGQALILFTLACGFPHPMPSVGMLRHFTKVQSTAFFFF